MGAAEFVWVRDLLLSCRWLDLADAGPVWWTWLAGGLFLLLAGGRWRLLGRRLACAAAGGMAGMSVAMAGGWLPEAARPLGLAGFAGIGGAVALWIELSAPRIGLSLVGWMLGAVLAHVSWVLGSSGWTITALAGIGAAASAWTWDVAPRPWSAFTGAAILCSCLGRSTDGPAVFGLAAVGLGLQWLTARQGGVTSFPVRRERGPAVPGTPHP